MMRIVNILGRVQMTGLHCPCPSSVTLEYLILILHAAAVSGQNGKATCSVSPVQLGQDVVLTCHFPEDLSVTKKDFTVYHYFYPNNPGGVIDCWFIKGELDCYTRPGYIYNKNIGRNLTVTVPHVQPEAMGTYACQVAGYRHNSIETCELHATANTCSVSKTNSSYQASLRCFFNEDIGKTKKDFGVYQHRANEHNLTVVLACRWEDGKPKCDIRDGYLFNYQVSVYLTIEISHEATNEPLNYSCSHSGSKPNQNIPCLYSFDKDKHFEDKLPRVIPIVVLSVLVFVLILHSMLVILYKRSWTYKSCFRLKQRRQEVICSEGEGQPTISKTINNQREITKKFKKYLENEIHGMFPNILNTFCFVPPVYFNKTQYKTDIVADEVFYVLDPPDLPDFRQDRAMQHVLHCLRHMAEQRQEHMFVLTQFRYEDYLNSPDSKYNKHKLPVPADLKEADKRTKCFDLLIFHRSLGVLVAVVKPVSGDGHDDQQELASLVELELSEAIQQLTMANRMLKHLMSDQDGDPIIRHAVIMPNLASSSLGNALKTNSEVVKNLLSCLGATREEKVEDLCLCAEHLSKPDTPWDVSSEVVSNVQRWFKKIMKNPVLDTSSYEKFYVSMIARFCGPATKSSLKVPNASAPFVLPKTLDEAVFVTGQMFERTVLNSDMAELLNSKKRFLYGPPNTGKTRMLTLVGRKWLSSGNDVFIVKDESSKSDSFLSEHLQALAASNTKLPKSTFGSVYTETCDLKQKTAEIINIIKRKTEKEIQLVLLDDVRLDEQNFKIVLETLLKEFPDLWVTSFSRNTCPEGLPESSLTCCLNCPPATLRVAPFADRVYGKSTGSFEASEDFFPTDGPPVKYIYHNKTVSSWVRSSFRCRMAIPWSSTSRECKECGLKVGEFLTKTLLIRKSDVAEMETRVNMSPTRVEHMVRSKSLLHCSDIMIVFECEGKKDNFLRGLRESGIAVRLLQFDKDKVVATDDDDDTALALTVGQMQMFRAKRKIVVYVESDSKGKDVENKQRAITSCTSQLIVVRVI